MRKTAERGYGGAHRASRRQLIRDMIEGQPCPRCGVPMYSTQKLAEAAGLHPLLWELHCGDWPGLALGGPQVKRLEHAHCNTRAGAIFGNRMRAFKRQRRVDPYDRW